MELSSCSSFEINKFEGITSGKPDSPIEFQKFIGNDYHRYDFKDVIVAKDKIYPVAGKVEIIYNNWTGTVEFSKNELPKWSLENNSDTESGVFAEED